MLAATAVWLPQEFSRQLFEEGGLGGMDLMLRWVEVHTWFSGQPVYGAVESADYLPASYVILWPALGWLTQEGARWLWAASTALALALLSIQLLRATCARTVAERAVFLLLPLAGYATAASVRLGQLGVHVIVLAVAGVLVASRSDRTWKTDLELPLRRSFILSQDPTYLAARAMEERRLAKASGDPRARRVHLELAANYALKAGPEVSLEQRSQPPEADQLSA